MKNAFYLIVFFLYSTIPAYSCDLCNDFEGFDPGYKQSAVGVMFSTSCFKGSHSHVNEAHNHNHTHDINSSLVEQYNTWSVWGRWYFKDKINLLTRVNFSDNYEKSDNENVNRISGIGDLSLVLNYLFLNDTTYNKVGGFQHLLTAGIGLVAPTGQYQNDNTNVGFNPLMQPGTGAFGGMFNMQYVIRKEKLSLNSLFDYRVNTYNKYKYRISNSFNWTSLISYEVISSTINLIASTGGFIEKAGMDIQDNSYLSNTGGMAFFTHLGMDLYVKEFSIGAAARLPVYENLYGEQGNNQARMIVRSRLAF